MWILGRMKQVQLKHLSHHLRRSYFQISSSSSYFHHSPLHPTSPIISRRPFDVFTNSVRFFAAPLQAQKKEEVKTPQGLRLNEQIRAEFVRLVSDDGHSVVARHEALQRAKSLKLDLVEVDRQAKPPVCKIMDYHKERYKKQVKEKERSKSKSVGAIKKGDCKEVRFSPKTELKDLEMKADMAKRLMERGYRVKCMVMGTEDQDLGGLLSKLSALIEDVAFVETGPRVERKQAYVIVRHVKFGPSKKGGKKASNIDSNTNSKIHSAATAGSQSPIEFGEQTYSEDSEVDNDDEIETPLPGQQETTWSASDANQDFGKMFDLSHDVKGTTTFADKQLKFDTQTTSSAANDASRFSPFANPNVRSVSQESENRYARNVKKNVPAARNPMRFPNYESQPQSCSNVRPAGAHKQAGSEGSASDSGSFQHSQNGIRRAQGEIPYQAKRFAPHSNFSAPAGQCEPPSSHSTGFDSFRSIELEPSGKYGSGIDFNHNYNGGSPCDATRVSGSGMAPGNLNSHRMKSHGSQGAGADNSRKWGVFSKDSSNPMSGTTAQGEGKVP